MTTRSASATALLLAFAVAGCSGGAKPDDR